MAQTHINAFFMAVDEAQERANQADAELEAAEIALEAKKKEVGYEDSEEETPKKK